MNRNYHVGSFIKGFFQGDASKRELSAREIAERFPECDADAFAQGMLDGIAGDRFRLDLIPESGWVDVA